MQNSRPVRCNKEKLEYNKRTYHLSCDLSELKGIIVSHRYTGVDVKIDLQTPIVNTATLNESIAKAKKSKEIYVGCKEIDDIYQTINFVIREIPFDYAGYYFHIEAECLDPLFEIQFMKSYRK